jgi:integrase
MGHIYRRGNIYWIKYYRNGKPYRESTKSKKEADAKRLLKKREGEISSGKLPGIHFDRVMFDELAEDHLNDLEINHRKTVKRTEHCIEHLRKAFEFFRVVDITTGSIKKYIINRISEGAANATINRELSALKRMLTLGYEHEPPKVIRIPKIPMLQENNVRQGYFEHGQFLALRNALPDYLKGFVTFAYKIGWREAEISKLKWQQVDLNQGIVRLEPGETKNKEGRTVYLDEELKQVFNQQWENRVKSAKITPFVFVNATGSDRIRDFRKVWNRACRNAGIGYGYKVNKGYVEKWQTEYSAGPIFHDFRRTAVRNMVRSGIPERVAMMVSGHKTRSVFERYNIGNDDDLKMAAQMQAAYLDSQMVTILGTISDLKQREVRP